MERMTEPDGLTGAAVAVQGIKDAMLLLHGQNGCRKGLLAVERCMPGDNVPFTDVSPADYYGGTPLKLERSLDELSDSKLLVVLETPALTLIGDDIDGLISSRDGRIHLDTDSLGSEVGTGFDRAMVRILEHIRPERTEAVGNGAIMIGLSVAHKDWRTVRMEMGHLMKNAGLRLMSTVGTDCTLDDLKESANASYCIVLDPEFSEETARFYGNLGLKIIGIGCQPIGFDRLTEFYDAVSEATRHRMDHAYEMLAKYRRRAYDGIKASGRSLIGKTYSIDAPESMLKPLSAWLEDSFGMVEDEFGHPDYLFTSGPKAVLEQASGRCGKGIAVRYPPARYDYVKSPVIGLDGSMFILDGLFNS